MYNYKYDITFDARDIEDKERVRLKFCGVDCIAEYHLNGVKIGEMKIDPNKNKITREVLSEAIRRYAPYAEYLPSSPYLSPQVLKKTLERTHERMPIRKQISRRAV